jgi:hypothetical protein
MPGPSRPFFYSFDCNEPKRVYEHLILVLEAWDGSSVSLSHGLGDLWDATPAQRANYEVLGGGHGVHWPDVDEDISAEGMLAGGSAKRPKE